MSKALERLLKSKKALDDVLEDENAEDTDKLEKAFDDAMSTLTGDKKKKVSKKSLKKAEDDDEADSAGDEEDSESDDSEDEADDEDDEEDSESDDGEEEEEEGDDEAEDDEEGEGEEMGKAGDYEEEEEEEEEEDEMKPPAKKKKKSKKAMVKKSKTFKDEFKTRATKEAKEALNVEPFLKALVTAFDAKFKSIESMIKSNVIKPVADIVEVQERQSEFLVSQGELVKSLYSGLDKQASQPQKRKSQLHVRERFQKSVNSDTDFDKAEVEEFLNKAAKENSIPGHLITKAETRLSKGLPLPDDVKALMLKARQEKKDN